MIKHPMKIIEIQKLIIRTKAIHKTMHLIYFIMITKIIIKLKSKLLHSLEEMHMTSNKSKMMVIKLGIFQTLYLIYIRLYSKVYTNMMKETIQ